MTEKARPERSTDVLAFTLFVPLPYDINLAGLEVFAYEDADPWAGWTHKRMGELIGLGAFVESGRRPSCKLSFRQIMLVRRSEPDAVDRTFDDIVVGRLNRRARLRRRLLARWALIRRRRESSTGVAVTLFMKSTDVFIDDLPAEALAQRAIATLNDYLVTLGLVSNDALVGRLSNHDFPTPLRYLVVVVSPEGNVRERFTETVGIHVWHPDLLDLPRDPDAVVRAANLFRAAREEREPSFIVYELRQTALREQLAGRSTQAAVTSATTIEVLVDLVLRRGWHAAGLPPDQLQGAMEDRLEARLERHLSRVLAVSIDVSDPTSEAGVWWQDAYRLRNKAVHEGRVPDFAEVRASIEATYNLMAFIGAGLARRPRTRGVAGSLPTRRAKNQRYGHLSSS